MIHGMRIEATAKKVGLSEIAARRRLRCVLGIDVPRTCEFSSGEIITGRWLETLSERLQVWPTEIAVLADASVSHWLKPENLAKPIRSILARPLLAVERRLKKGFLGYPDKSAADLAATALPNLREQRGELTTAMRILSRTEGVNGALAVELNSLAEHSRNEVSKTGPAQSHRCLCWLAEISRYRGARPPDPIHFLADKYGVGVEWMRRTLSENGSAIPLETTRAIISPLISTGTKKRGRRPGRLRDTADRIKKAANLLVAGFGETEMAPHLFPDKPASAVSNTFNLFHNYRKEIELAKLKRTPGAERVAAEADAKTPTPLK